ncbi:YajG family lipoprotein [Zhongshania aquimaris]|uniref:YajG family lipoprotein n=1 Tax=Zhongshania aquimaris TaxID=2857107 RepID=A0ABS6VP56_9GAMM|nr:YajG family lipoprotein [Zhongshania aquimaris]MBW2940089.1 YajG family lipoprotein [Zhongshania aquimaris]
MSYTTVMKGFVLATALLITACAQSPQAIKVAPEFPAPTQANGSDSPVHIRVSDKRADKVLGSRGGTYRDTSVITLASDLSLPVEKALSSYMAAMGYDVDSLNPNTTDLHVIFTSLVYDHPKEGGVGYDMDMLATVEVEARRGNEHYEGRYRVKRNQKFFNAPSNSHNSKMVNELVVEVLSSMFSDPRLVAFLQKN